MADLQRHALEFETTGYGLAALSVDAPPRSAKLRRDLALSFPLLCDPQRQAVRDWDLFNQRERGGIAWTATFVIAADGFIRLAVKEAVARRVRAAELLRYLVAEGGQSPGARGIWPRARDWWRAFFH